MSGFESLGASFVKCYEQFSNHLKGDGQYDRTRDLFFLFGVSRAGKSTLLSRMLSPDSEEVFYKKITRTLTPEADDVTFGADVMHVADAQDHITIAGIKIGFGPLATTLFPKISRATGDLQVCDMPGFYDPCPDRRLIISILHKCLLTRVTRCRYLVVLDVQAIDQGKMETLISYCEAFNELFGEHFPRCLGHIHFVLTKNDQLNFTADEIIAKINRRIFDAAAIPTPNLQGFLSRLRAHHLLVDHRKYSGVALVNGITELIRRGVEGEQENLNFVQLAIDALDISQDTLNEKCMNEISRLALANMENGKQFAALEKEHPRKRDEFRSHLDNAIGAHRANERALGEKRKQLADVEAMITTYDARHKAAKDAVEALDSERTFCETQLKFIENVNKTEEAVSFQAFVSRKCFLSGFDAEVCIDCTHSHARERFVILVTKYEERDQSLRAHIRSSFPAGQGPPDSAGTLTPLNLAAIENCTPSTVLYNSKGPVFNGKVKCEWTFCDKYLTIKAEANEKFKLFVYFSTPFCKTGDFLMLERTYRKEFTCAEAKYTDAVQKVQQIEEQQVADQATQRQLRVALQTGETALAHSRDVLRQESNHAKEVKSALLVKVAAVRLDVDKVEKSNSHELVSRINGIFEENTLRTNLTGKIRNFHDGVNKIRADLAALEGEIILEESQWLTLIDSTIGKAGAKTSS